MSDLEKKYSEVWRLEMLTRNSMTAEYFHNHFRVKSVSVWKPYDGTNNQYCRVDYKFSIDYASVELTDKFILWKSASDPLFPDYPLPRDQWLTRADIATALDTRTNYSSMNTIYPAQHLYFKNKSQAEYAMEQVEKKMKFQGFTLFGDARAGAKMGHLRMGFGKTISEEDNNCLAGDLDLITGSAEVTPTVCWFQ